MINEMEELKKIGKRILAVRKRLYMQQNEFAKEMGVSNGSLSMMETGKTQPRFELLFNMGTKYSVNLAYIFFGRGEMFLPKEIDAKIETKKYGPETEEWLQEFIHYFNESRVFRYEVMSHLSRFMLDNRDLIDRDMKSRDEDKDDE